MKLSVSLYQPCTLWREIVQIAKVAAQVTLLLVMNLDRITNRRKEELEHLHRAATAIAGAFDLKQVLQTIVVEARKMVGADSSSIWPYDPVQDKFIPSEMVTTGIPAAEIKRFRKEAPRPGRTAYTVLRKNWIGVPDVRSTKFMGQTTRALLQRIEVMSFEGIALKTGNEPVGVLYVNYKHPRTFGPADRAALENFAAYAALSLKRARLLDQVRNAKSTVETVTNLMALGDIDATLRSVVEGTHTVLNCDAVTLYTYDQAKEGLACPPTNLGVLYPERAWPYREVPTNSFVYKSLQQDHIKVVERVSDDRFFKKSRFARDEGIESCVVIPLKVAEQKVGLMFVNYRERHRFTDEERSSIQHFADQAALAIANSQLYGRAQKRATALDGLYRASHTIISSLSLKKTLNQVAQQALKILGIGEVKRCFSSVTFRTDNKLDVIAASPPRVVAALRRGLSQVDLGDANSRRGIVGLAAITGEVQNVGDVRSRPDYIPAFRYIRSQLSVPLKIGTKVIGVLNVEHPDLNAFTDEDERNIEMLARQAVVAIHNAQQHEVITRDKESLESLHQAAKAMAGVADFTGVLRVIVEKAKEIFGADSCALWPYDETQGRFLRGEPVAVGINSKELERFREEEPKPGRTSYTVLKKGWVGLSDLGPTAEFLGQQTVELLRGIKVKSFQGVALRVADEPVGVLYVNYKRQRSFDERDRGQMENFARYAALSLLKARLAHQVKTAKSMIEVAAAMTALGETKSTLLSVTAGTQSAVECDAVVLFTYDRTTGKLIYPPEHRGIRYPERAFSADEARADSLEYAMLRKDDIYIVEQTSKARLFKGRSFASLEHIESFVAIPLIALGQKVGLMFVNYRKHHRFDNDELISIKLFANQAAVAISNSQLYAQVDNQARVLEKQTKALSGLYEAGRAITSSLSLADTLERICQQALRVTDSGGGGCFSHVALREGNTFSYAAASSEEILSRLQKTTSRVSLRPPDPQSKIKWRIGIVGREVITQKVQNVPDVRADPDYHQISRIIRSQLSVPLKIGREVIGVLSIEHPEIAAFSGQDERNIELLAAQAAVAIKNAQQFGELERTKGLVGSVTALAWMGMASNVWRHEIDGHASTMKLALQRLRAQIQKAPLRPGQRKEIEERLETMASQTNQILNGPLPPPLSDDEGIGPILINDLVNDRLRQLRESGLLSSIRTRFSLTKDDTTILCSNDWLTRAFDIVIDNAIKAMSSSKRPLLTISTRAGDGKVRVIFKDTGKGIPGGVSGKLFRERIKKPSETGMGMGLLMLQAIVQAYGGAASVASSSAEGTTMVLTFPHRGRAMRPSHE